MPDLLLLSSVNIVIRPSWLRVSLPCELSMRFDMRSSSATPPPSSPSSSPPPTGESTALESLVAAHRGHSLRATQARRLEPPLHQRAHDPREERYKGSSPARGRSLDRTRGGAAQPSGVSSRTLSLIPARTMARSSQSHPRPGTQSPNRPIQARSQPASHSSANSSQGTSLQVIQLRPEDTHRSRRQFAGHRLYTPSSRDIVLALPGGRTFSQHSHIPHNSNRRQSQAASTALSMPSENSRPQTPAIASSLDDSSGFAIGTDDLMNGIIVSIAESSESLEDRRAREHAKKQRQVERWLGEVLPSLLPPYLHLLRVSHSLRDVQHDAEAACTCDGWNTSSLTVVCVYFNRMCSCLRVSDAAH